MSKGPYHEIDRCGMLGLGGIALAGFGVTSAESTGIFAMLIFSVFGLGIAAFYFRKMDRI